MPQLISWPEKPIGQCLIPTSRLAKPTIPKSEYRPSGRFPIIDQGQSFIAGWTENDSAVISADLPIIVFGDHTRAIKFLDFPFARGADGTQLLRPVAEFDPRFFFFACRSVSLESRGYNRHFALLKECLIPVPPREEQERIAALLHRTERLLNYQDQLLVNLQGLKASTLSVLFTQSLLGEPQKETEIGPIPESWSVSSIGIECMISSGGTPSRSAPEYWQGGRIPWVKTTEIDYGMIMQAEESITEEGMANSAAKMLPEGAILMAMYGQGVTRGKVAMLGISATTNQACAAIIPASGRLRARFLYHFLAGEYESIRNLAHGGQQQNLNLGLIRSIRIPVPPTHDEQEGIASTLDLVDEKIRVHERKRAVLNELLKTLLQKLMTGEVRVGDLDLGARPGGEEVAA